MCSVRRRRMNERVNGSKQEVPQETALWSRRTVYSVHKMTCCREILIRVYRQLKQLQIGRAATLIRVPVGSLKRAVQQSVVRAATQNVLLLAYIPGIVPVRHHTPFLLLHLLKPCLAQPEPDTCLELHIFLSGEDEERPRRWGRLPFEDPPHVAGNSIRSSHVGPVEQKMGAGIMR